VPGVPADHDRRDLAELGLGDPCERLSDGRRRVGPVRFGHHQEAVPDAEGVKAARCSAEHAVILATQRESRDLGSMNAWPTD
jgi:hypothetical protein